MALTDENIMYFGKFAGINMKNIEASYLNWLNKQPWLEKQHPEVYEYIQKNMNAIEQELEELEKKKRNKNE